MERFKAHLACVNERRTVYSENLHFERVLISILTRQCGRTELRCL